MEIAPPKAHDVRVFAALVVPIVGYTERDGRIVRVHDARFINPRSTIPWVRTKAFKRSKFKRPMESVITDLFAVNSV
jgi:hypothetical protein